MTPSERIALIREISPRLGREEWRLIDLVLRQFGFRTTNDWNGPDRGGYVMAMIEDASDAQLEGLAAHVGVERTQDSPAVAPSFWRPGAFRLFISHVSSNKVAAADLQDALGPLGVSAFVAHNDIEPTKEWLDELEVALSTADALVALLSPGFHESKWTDHEVGFVSGRGRLVIGVTLGEAPYGFIARQQALAGVGLVADALADRLLGILLVHKQTERRMSEALVSMFERADSFREARDAMSMLERSKYWDDRLSERIDAATRENGQITHSWGVPERVAALIAARRAHAV